MPHNYASFLNALNNIREERPDAASERPDDKDGGQPLSGYRIVPDNPSFDDTTPETGVPQNDRPEGYELLTQTLQALEERYPFQAAVIELQTVIHILRGCAEEQHLEKLRPQDYDMMLALLDDMSGLAEQCRHCPANPSADSGKTQ